MNTLQIEDVFEPYYVGRKPFLPRRLDEQVSEQETGDGRSASNRRNPRRELPAESRDANSTEH